MRFATLNPGHDVAARTGGLSNPLTAADVARLRGVALSLLVTVVFRSKEQAKMYACRPQIFPGDYDPDEDLGRPPEPKEAPFEALDIATHPVAIHRLVEDICWNFLGSPPEKVPIVADIDDLDNMLGMSKQLRNYLEGGRWTISGVPLVNITWPTIRRPRRLLWGPTAIAWFAFISCSSASESGRPASC